MKLIDALRQSQDLLKKEAFQPSPPMPQPAPPMPPGAAPPPMAAPGGMPMDPMAAPGGMPMDPMAAPGGMPMDPMAASAPEMDPMMILQELMAAMGEIQPAVEQLMQQNEMLAQKVVELEGNQLELAKATSTLQSVLRQMEMA